MLTLTTQLWPFLFITVLLPRLKFIVQVKSLEGAAERRIQAVHTAHAEGKNMTPWKTERESVCVKCKRLEGPWPQIRLCMQSLRLIGHPKGENDVIRVL